MKEVLEQIKQIENSIQNNSDCISNLLNGESCVHYTDKGYMPSKDKEILALLSKSYYGKSFYGHVFKENRSNKWISLIIWSPKLFNRDSLFKEYADAVENLEFAPCAIQDDAQSFKINNTFNDACASLKNMINLFKIEDRMYNNEGEFHSKDPLTRYEMRTYSICF